MIGLTINNSLKSFKHVPQNNQSLSPSTRCCNCSYSSNRLSNKQFEHCKRNKALSFWPVPYPAGGEGLQMAMAPLLQQPIQHVHPFQFLPEWQLQLQQFHPLQFQPQLQQMNNTCPHCSAKYFREELNTRNKYTKYFRAHLHPLQGQQPKYAELYIMDIIEALEHRANSPTNRDFNKDTIKKLQDELIAVNPYYSPAAAEIAAICSTKDAAAPDPIDRIMHIQG
eukprot:gene2508-biopygen1376